MLLPVISRFASYRLEPGQTDINSPRRQWTRLAGIALALSMHLASSAASVTAARSVRIVCLGDSTTFGNSVRDSYPRLLARALFDARYSSAVINSGVNGDTTQGGRERFERDVLAHAPDIVVIQFGLNDQTVRLYEPAEKVASYVSEQQFVNNLRFFTTELRRRRVASVLMTANPMCWTPTLERHYPTGPYLNGPRGGNTLLQRYVEAERSLAHAEKIPLVDVFKEYGMREGNAKVPLQQLFLDDGVHPNEVGYRLNVELLQEAIRPLLRQAPAHAVRRDYFVIKEGQLQCAYVAGRGCRAGDNCYMLTRTEHERNPRDCVSTPAPLDDGQTRACIELTAADQSEWEIKLDAVQAINFSTISGDVRTRGPQLEESTNKTAYAGMPKIAAGPMNIELNGEGRQLRVKIDDQLAATFEDLDQPIGPIELAITLGTIRVRTFHIR